MQNLSPFEKIDFVLNLLKEHKTSTYGQLRIESANPADPQDHEFHAIVNKLIKDEYVVRYESGQYALTFEGSLFIGYDKERILREEEVLRISYRGINDNNYKERLFWATLIAGIFAGLLLLWQVFLYFYPVHKDYPLWFWQK